MEKTPARNRRSHCLPHGCPRPARLPAALTGRPGSRWWPWREAATNPKRSLRGLHVVPRRVVGTRIGAHGDRAAGRPNLLRDQQSCARLPRQFAVALNRRDRDRGRADMRDRATARGARTHRVIERHGLVRTDGAAGSLPGEPRHIITWCRRRVVRAFDLDRKPLSPQLHVRRQEGIR